MEQSADCLLDDAGAEALGCSCRHRSGRRSLTRVVVRRCGRNDGAVLGVRGQILADDVAVIFLASAAEGFEKNDEEDHTNARSSEHALRGDMP